MCKRPSSSNRRVDELPLEWLKITLFTCMHCRIALQACGTTEWHKLPPYLLLLFDQRQICDVCATLQTANVIGRLTTNLEKTLIEKYSEIDNTEIFLK